MTLPIATLIDKSVLTCNCAIERWHPTPHYHHALPGRIVVIEEADFFNMFMQFPARQRTILHILFVPRPQNRPQSHRNWESSCDYYPHDWSFYSVILLIVILNFCT